MDLQEEIEALRAILMNDVTVDPSGGEMQVDIKLEGYTITIKLQGEMFIILKGHFACFLTLHMKLTEDSYHSRVPEIRVVESGVHLGYVDTNALERYLIQTAQSQLQDSYLYSLYQAGQDWIQDSKAKVLTTSDPSSTTPVCKYFMEGRCKFNEKCRNLHPGTHTNNSSTERTDQTHRERASQGGVDNNNGDRAMDENTKKPRMRTAMDVISRIQWDPELLEDDFVIGYSDRFLGIIEKNFAEFCWEDPSTVGHDILAIPKHRIQYFKYKTAIVWDRRIQMDKFFGSRGEGTTIHELVQKYKEKTLS